MADILLCSGQPELQMPLFCRVLAASPLFFAPVVVFAAGITEGPSPGTWSTAACHAFAPAVPIGPRAPRPEDASAEQVRLAILAARAKPQDQRIEALLEAATALIPIMRTRDLDKVATELDALRSRRFLGMTFASDERERAVQGARDSLARDFYQAHAAPGSPGPWLSVGGIVAVARLAGMTNMQNDLLRRYIAAPPVPLSVENVLELANGASNANERRLILSNYLNAHPGLSEHAMGRLRGALGRPELVAPQPAPPPAAPVPTPPAPQASAATLAAIEEAKQESASILQDDALIAYFRASIGGLSIEDALALAKAAALYDTQNMILKEYAAAKAASLTAPQVIRLAQGAYAPDDDDVFFIAVEFFGAKDQILYDYATARRADLEPDDIEALARATGDPDAHNEIIGNYLTTEADDLDADVAISLARKATNRAGTNVALERYASAKTTLSVDDVIKTAYATYNDDDGVNRSKDRILAAYAARNADDLTPDQILSLAAVASERVGNDIIFDYVRSQHSRLYVPQLRTLRDGLQDDDNIAELIDEVIDAR